MTRRRPAAPPPLSELELEVMGEVWKRGHATVRDVLDALNSGRKQRAYTTVMTIMSRLDAHKGLLQRTRKGKTDVYSATLSREQYMDARVESEVGALVRDYGEVALTHFARQMDKLDEKRAQQLRRLADGD